MKISQDLRINPALKDLIVGGIEQSGGKCEEFACFSTDTGCKIIHTIETGEHGRLRHVSISHANRYPTWEEIRDTKEYLFDRKEDAMMVLPRKSLYVNVHPNCFHLWQMPFRWEYM